MFLGIFGASSGFAQQGLLETRVFHDPGKRSQIRAAWQLSSGSLHYYRAADSTVSATFDTEIRIFRDSSLVKTERWTTRTPPVYPAQVPYLKLTDGYNQAAPEGNYQFEVTITEPGFSANPLQMQSPIRVKTLSGTGLSQLLLADTVFNATASTSGAFVQKQHFVLPLVSAFLDDNRDTLRYYAEAYTESGNKEPLHLQFRIGKVGGIPDLISRTDGLAFQNRVAPFAGAVDIRKLPTGNYTAEIRLLDKQNRVLASETTLFQRSNLGMVATAAPIDSLPEPARLHTDTAKAVPLPIQGQVVVENHFLDGYKSKELRAILRMVLPLAKPDEALAIRTLQDDAVPQPLVRSFLYAFFAARDAVHPENFWKNYSDQVRAVNRLFNLGARAGYSTDRGRAYLQYGAPGERIPVFQETGSRPYEIWRYPESEKMPRGGTILFVQLGTNMDDYLLVHSTLEGETRNRMWRQLLYPEGVNEASKAELYFPER